MKYYKHACLIMIILCVGRSYGQAWKQYSDSAKNLVEQKKMDQAIGMYSKAMEALQKDSAGASSYAAISTQLADLYKETSQFAKAEPLYLESRMIQEKLNGKNNAKYGNSCNDLANLYWYMDQFEKAELLFLEMKELARKLNGEDHFSYASTCNNLASLYSKMGEYGKAESLYLEAKQIQARVLGKQHPDYGRSCNNLGMLYWNIGQYAKAEPLMLEAKQVREKHWGKEHPAYASSCNSLALLYWKTKRYREAELLYLEANKITEKQLSKQHPEYAASCSNLASVYLDMGQYAKAEPLYLEAKQIQLQAYGKDQPDYAGSCYNLAILYGLMGEYVKAEPLYLEAKQIQAKVLGKQHPDYGLSCENLGYLYWQLQRPLLAQKEFEEAFSVKSHNLNAVFQFTNDKEKTAYIKNVLGEDERIYSLYVSAKISSDLPYSLSLFHRNLILSSAQALRKELMLSKDTSLSRKYNEWAQLKKKLATLYSMPVAEREDAAATEENTGMLEKELTRLSAAFAKQQRTIDWKEIRNHLQADEAAIEFISFQFDDGKRLTDTVLYAAILIRKNMPLPVMIPLCREKQLTDLLSVYNHVSNLRNVQGLYTSVPHTSKGKKDSSTSLYELIWKPVEKALTGIKTIYFAPSGLLHRIAFAAMPLQQKEVLSDRYRLVQLATTASLVDQQQTHIAASDKIQLYGGINYHADTIELKKITASYRYKNIVNEPLSDDLTRSGEWNELPGTVKEIEGILALSGGYRSNVTALSGLNATEESLEAMDGTASPAVLHIATHGFFFPDAKSDSTNSKGTVFKSSDDPMMRSGLLFAGANHAWQNKAVSGIHDGVLTAYEVSNLSLPNTKLVVLSACETGLGELHGSEGVYGLQRAFKIAGARNLVMSLWKVTDQETAEFMGAFYKQLFIGQSINDAFYSAQKAMKNTYRLQPYKWAAWVLVR